MAILFACQCARTHASGRGRPVHTGASSIASNLKLTQAMETPLVPAAAAVQPAVHLSLGASAGDMVVTWSSAPVTASGERAVLSYGAAATALHSTVVATSLNNLSRIALNRATIRNVTAGDTVFYRVSGDSRVLNFTHRTPHGRKGPVTFAIFGDLGIKEQDGANYTLARLKQHHIAGEFEAILHVGDIAYDLQDNGGKTGDEFLQDWEPVASQVPYMTVPGK